MYEGKTRITYYDLDFRGKVKLSAILKMVHIAADINANQLGIGFATLYPLNMSFVIQRFGLKITRMPVYDENVTIRTWPAEVARGTFIRKGDMYDMGGKKIMEWASLWILFDIASRKILKPSALVSCGSLSTPIVIPSMTDVGVDVEPEKVVIPTTLGMPFSQHIHTVRYSDVDTNMHMNNSVYGDLIGNAAFPDSCLEYPDWKEVQINYLGETRLGEEINITAHKGGDDNVILGEISSTGRPSFAASVRV